MRSIINELWHGNIIPQEDGRNNTKEMKELLTYISRHHEDLRKASPMSRKKPLRNSMIVGASMRVLLKRLYLNMLSSSVQKLRLRL